MPWMAGVAGVGILIGVAFALRALTKAFFGGGSISTAPHPLPPITWPERLGAFLLLGTTIVVGLYPRILTDLILPSLNSPLFEGLRTGARRVGAGQ